MLAAAALSSLGRCAAGSFVKREPELVPVEGVFRSALGGVKPLTDIAPTKRPEDNTAHNNAGGEMQRKAYKWLLGGVPTATPVERGYG